MKSTMYPNNPYIQGHEEIVEICKSMHKDTNSAFVIFDQRHGLKHDDLAQAQYEHWRAEITGVPELLSKPDREILIANGFITAD